MLSRFAFLFELLNKKTSLLLSILISKSILIKEFIVKTINTAIATFLSGNLQYIIGGIVLVTLLPATNTNMDTLLMLSFLKTILIYYLILIFVQVFCALIALLFPSKYNTELCVMDLRIKIAFLKAAFIQKQYKIRRRKYLATYVFLNLYKDFKIALPIMLIPTQELFNSFSLKRSKGGEQLLDVSLNDDERRKIIFELLSVPEYLHDRDRILIQHLIKYKNRNLMKRILVDIVSLNYLFFNVHFKPTFDYFFHFVYKFILCLTEDILNLLRVLSFDTKYRNRQLKKHSLYIFSSPFKTQRANDFLSKKFQTNFNMLLRLEKLTWPGLGTYIPKKYYYLWLFYKMSAITNILKYFKRCLLLKDHILTAKLIFEKKNARQYKIIRVDGRIDQFLLMLPVIQNFKQVFVLLFISQTFLSLFVIGFIIIIKLFVSYVLLSLFLMDTFNYYVDEVFNFLNLGTFFEGLYVKIINLLYYSTKSTILFDVTSKMRPLDFINVVISCLILLIVLLGMVAFFTLLERKLLAAVQHRKGPNIAGIFGILQPVADGVKLIFKQNVIPSSSNKSLFILAPVFIFCLSFTAWSVIPFGLNLQITTLDFDILFLLAVSSLSVYGIILGGWSSNSKYAFLGSLRSAGQMLSYEIALGLSILPVVLITGGFNLNFIVIRQEIVGWNMFSLFPAFIIFVISMLVETNRHPFDLPEAEAELVAGYNVEYGGFFFAFYFLAEYASMILMSFLGSLLFLGGWSTGITTDIILDNLALEYRGIFLAFAESLTLMLKNCIFFYFFVLVRAFLPRTRPDQLMGFGWKVLLPISFAYVIFILGVIQAFDCGPAPFIDNSYLLIV